MRTIWQDIRFSLRMLSKNHGFTVVAITTLAVGIGVNAAIFSLINGWMLRPLPGQRAGDMVRLYSRDMKQEGQYCSFSYPYFAALREGNHSFVSLSAFSPRAFELREQGITRTAFGAYVSSDFFDTLGITPALGRFFTEDEERPGSHVPVGIISHRLWQHMGSDPELVGRTVIINDTPLTVVGILPECFVSASQITNKEIWLPLGMIGGFKDQTRQGAPSRLSTHTYRGLFLIGQLKPGLTAASVESHLEPLAAGLASRYPAEYGDLRLSAGPIGHILMSHEPDHDFSIRKPLGALIAVSGTILLIACLNLAHMFLARCMTRRREIIIRLALGSSRFRIIRQLVVEGLLLSMAGGILGVILALWSIRIPIQVFEQWTGGEGTIPTELDWRLLLAGMSLCIISTLVFCLGPAWRLTKAGALSPLRESVASTASIHTWWRKVMITAQVTLAFVLVTCAGLFVQSARAAAQANPGFALDRGLLIELALKQQQGPEIYQRILTRLRSLPGVRSVSLASTVSFGDAYISGTYQRADMSPLGEGVFITARSNVIGADYFKSLGVPLLRGREFTFTEEQSNKSPRVALIDEILAQSLWPEENPIGQYLRAGDNITHNLQVVGLVPHLRDSIIETQANAHVYLPFGQHYDSHMFVYTQLSDSIAPVSLRAFKKVIRRELQAMDPALPIRGIRTWKEHIERFSFQFLTIKLGAKLFATLGFLALGLAAVGLYGIKSYWVSQRTREIGIRMALGATERRVTCGVLREGLMLILTGLGIGLFLTWICTRFLESILCEVSGTDPMVLLTTMIVLAVAILMASLIPAWRAAKIDPMEALRCE